jgi:hypothetical protein
VLYLCEVRLCYTYLKSELVRTLWSLDKLLIGSKEHTTLSELFRSLYIGRFPHTSTVDPLFIRREPCSRSHSPVIPVEWTDR